MNIQSGARLKGASGCLLKNVRLRRKEVMENFFKHIREVGTNNLLFQEVNIEILGQ